MVTGRHGQRHDLAVLSVGFVERPDAGADEAHDVLVFTSHERVVVVIGEDSLEPPLHLGGRRLIAQLAYESGDGGKVRDGRRSDHDI